MIPQPRRPLFERFSRVQERLAHLALADLPTPVRTMTAVADRVGAGGLWLKDDGPSSARYGGNKVRKLEFLLGDALSRRARAVMTFGYAGSNHATATAIHAASVGVRSISMLLPQHNAAYLRSNLLVSAAVGADIHEFGSRAALVAGTVLALARGLVRDGRLPYVIAPGGSSPLGTIGFVNAAFELDEQVSAGLLPRPAVIYAAGGSLGTVVGLGIGLAVLGWPTRIHAVRVVDEQFVNPRVAGVLWRKTIALLRDADPSFPDIAAPADRIVFRSEFFGGLYALETSEGKEAAAIAAEDGLSLDLTYTSKTLACLLADARAGRLAAPALFWSTCNSSDIGGLAAQATTGDLRPRLRRYFDTTMRSD
ncbi:MAG TPA: pyridoxal-phosphate dependent enzyme [Candidatus Binatia bacterium]|jgi:D-cysteine desulfhydrase